MDELNKLLASKKQSVSILHEKPVLYDCRPNIAEVVRSQAVVDECESEIRRMHTANEHLKKGENTLAEFYLGRKLAPEEKNTNVQYALNDIVYTTSNEISSKKKEILNKNIKEMTDNLKNAPMPLSAPTIDLPAKTLKIDSSLISYDPVQEDIDLADLEHFIKQEDIKPDIDPIWGWNSEEKHTKKEVMEQANIMGLKVPDDKDEAERLVSEAVLMVQHQTGGLDTNRLEKLISANKAIDDFKETSTASANKKEFKTLMSNYGVRVSGRTLLEMKAAAVRDINIQKEFIHMTARAGQTGHGMLVKFGSHYYNENKLKTSNIFTMKKTLTSKASKQIVVSDALKQAIIESKPNSELTEEEMNYFNYLCKRVDLPLVHKLKPTKLTTTSANNNRLKMKILMGSIQSGNDNPQLLEDMKKLAAVMASKRQLTDKQIEQISLFI